MGWDLEGGAKDQGQCQPEGFGGLGALWCFGLASGPPSCRWLLLPGRAGPAGAGGGAPRPD
eukprot:2849875-Lingulodinium_polyedra.AAC.1